MTQNIELLAISVGTPQEITINGKTVHTAIIKHPIQGAIFISRKGPIGDKPAVHPDAVYAISAEHYDHWSQELSLDRQTLSWGFFGENLTLKGIDETTLRIGDILHIGHSVQLQVVSARVPCSKLAWRLGQADTFLKPFSLSGKTGFYLKVLQEGTIQAGDKISLFPTTAPVQTIAELSCFLAKIEEATEDQLHHVLSQEHLGMTSQEMIQRRLAFLQDLKIAKKGRWSGWRRFVVERIIQETPEIKSFWLKPEDKQPIGGYRPGQFITCRLPSNDSESLIRTWTIADFNPAGDAYRISIKMLPEGKGSSYMHRHVQVGSVLEVKPPNGSFTLDRSTSRPIVLISAGVGITPMLAMLKGYLTRQLQPLPYLYFIHASRNGKTHLFREEIKQLIAGKERIKTLTYYSQPTQEDRMGIDYDIEGHFNIKDVAALMKGCQIYWGNRWQQWPKEEGRFHLCGPEGFQESVKKSLLAWSVKEAHLLVESFNPLSGKPIGVKAESAQVVFSKSRITAHWSEKEDFTLLELAEKVGIQAPNACRMGVCETCEVFLEKGEVFYEHGHLSNRSQNTVLTCCSKPGSDEVVIAL